MGRPIQKKWMSAKAGSVEGNLRLLCNTGSEATRVIESQTGTSSYYMDTTDELKIVTLVNKTSSPALGEGILLLGGKAVSKLTQYRAYFFDGSDSVVWRDSDSELLVTFSPTLSVEDGDPGAPADAIATFTVTHETGDANDNQVLTIEIDEAGYGYDTAPTITFTTGTGSTATATCTIDGLGQVDSVTLVSAGSYTDAEAAGGIVATVPAP